MSDHKYIGQAKKFIDMFETENENEKRKKAQ